MSSAHNYEFDEKSIRTELRQHIIRVRQKHETIVSELLTDSRLKSTVGNEAVKPSTGLSCSLEDFVPKAKASESSQMKFSLAAFHKNTHWAPLKKQIVRPSISLPFVAPLPLYKDYTPLTMGVHVEDDEVLRYLPYFGENGEEDGLNLEEIFEDKTESHAEVLRREKAQFLAADIFHFMANYGLSKTQLVSYFLFHVGSNAAVRKLVLPDNFELDEKKRKQLEEHTRKLDSRIVWKIELICRIFKDMTRTSIWEILNLYPANALIDDKRSSLRSSQSAATFSLDSYSSLLCSFCFMHECPWHDSTYLTVAPDGSIRPPFRQECDNTHRSTAARKIIPEDVPCSSDCFMKQSHKPDSLTRAVEWKDNEISTLKMTASVMIRNERASCLLATIIDKSCREIHAKLEELKLVNVLTKVEKPGSKLHRLDSPTSQITGNKKKRKAQTGYPDDCSLSGNHSKRGNVNPCMHTGPCDSHCPAVISKVFCEKGCACPASCPRRWRGCRCTTGRCRTSACECFKWNRECDPDLCRSCGADHVLDPKNRGIVDNKHYCKNVNLQRGLGKRVIVGPSNVSGWGLFMGESIKQDEYLGEYKGELISQDEAERRGKIYDKRGVSFLFESTKDQCVDATRAGNKLRFINHSRQNPNCHARILLVNGIHRIAFFARRRIKEGEELFIDYGYNNKTMKFVPLEYVKPSRFDLHDKA
ncbi:hypothetical protein V1525DRAFT_448022 [Lipomyces kononenkoae]|uniref:Uncharacterized protein n=1 Tax=Lipomyces kononenkoae TaxID=34357 RepID=A0ACC3TAP6_LIPKO